MAIKNYWIMKTEPSVFSFENLIKAPQKTTHWEGVRNYQARNFMRDLFKKGDSAFVYHSNTDVIGIYGLAEVVKEGYPDYTALDPKSRYFDEKDFKKGSSSWIMVDIKATHILKKPLTLEFLKTEPKLKQMMLLQKGSRLSVQPVTQKEFDILSQLAEMEKI